MNRRTLLAALATSLLSLALSLAPSLAPSLAAHAEPVSAADQADIDRVQTYLNGIRTLKARFLQVAADGSTSQGTAWLERPGRMRFEYDPPSPLLLVAGHGMVVFHDAKLEQTSNIPLGRTPLGILLADKVDFSGAVTVQSINRLPGQIQLTMARSATPAEGSLTLILSDAPLQLSSWVVLDAQRQETRVSLFDVQLGGNFDAKLFEFVDPKFFNAPQNGG